MDQDILYWVWLGSLSNITLRKKYKLLQTFGSPYDIWHASKNELLKNQSVSPEMAAILSDRNIKELTKRKLEDLYVRKIKILPLKNSNYPACLKEIYDPPIVLYVMGELLDDELCLAVVGSRNATEYGRNMAEKISYELAINGFTITSGMARGIDSSAHIGALRANGRTIAVLGCGLDMVYPHENKELMEIISKNGAVISEYVTGTNPLPANFPARNRIISGLSIGVTVIEANERSGSLITANIALEQGRDVFAVPGNADSNNSLGTNRLIKEGARLVTGVDDILEELKFSQPGILESKENLKEISQSKVLRGLTGEERIIAEKLTDGKIQIDALADKCNLSMQLINSTLVIMELKGIVEQLPGKIFGLKI
ncbi:MAG: DNA-processing protein DprA [Bacillota bacterium]|nr:DNA-processing protein DprA [Bacillota bacterium]